MAKVKVTNGVSFGALYTVTEADATAEEVTFEFTGLAGKRVNYDVVATIQVTDDNGVVVDLDDAVITYGKGTVTIANGYGEGTPTIANGYGEGTATTANGAANFALTENQVIAVVGSRVKAY